MRMRAYIRAVGDEAIIRSLHERTAIRSATITQLKAPVESRTNEFWWNWETESLDVNPQDVDKDVKKLLETYRPHFHVIKKYKEQVDLYLEIVTYYHKEDRPEGLYLSAECVSLLNELGAALDNDAVPEHLSREKKSPSE